MSPDILGPHAGLVVGARALLKPRERRDQKLFLAEGPQAVREALNAGLVQTLLVDHTRDAMVEEFGDEATAFVTSRAIESLSETEQPQGVVAVCTMPLRTLEDVLAEGPQLLAVCVGISDPGNLGTIIRTADAAGADAVLVTSGSVDVFNGKIIRSSAGSIFHLPVVQGLDAVAMAQALSGAGVASYGLAGQGATSLFDLADEQLIEPTAWWLGSEAHGLPGELLTRVQAVSIPMPGEAESLNVAVAAAIALFATVRARFS
ncbi:MAG: TrmH family RNA methyltransferase [Candidatus Nanopelagicales bacterium]